VRDAGLRGALLEHVVDGDGAEAVAVDLPDLRDGLVLRKLSPAAIWGQLVAMREVQNLLCCRHALKRTEATSKRVRGST